MPGLARQQHDLPLAGLGQLPAIEQKPELVLAADQRHEGGVVHRFETALGGADPDHPPGPDGLGETLEVLRTEVGELEDPADEPPRAPADDDAARRGERLQAGRQIGVWPTTACSCAAPAPTRSPTTTRPVAMPTRAANGPPSGDLSSPIASVSARPARTARSASFSCAWG